MLIYNVFRQIESNNDHNIEKKVTKCKNFKETQQDLTPKKLFIWPLYFETPCFQTLPESTKHKTATKWHQTKRKHKNPTTNVNLQRI